MKKASLFIVLFLFPNLIITKQEQLANDCSYLFERVQTKDLEDQLRNEAEDHFKNYDENKINTIKKQEKIKKFNSIIYELAKRMSCHYYEKDTLSPASEKYQNLMQKAYDKMDVKKNDRLPIFKSKSKYIDKNTKVPAKTTLFNIQVDEEILESLPKSSRDHLLQHEACHAKHKDCQSVVILKPITNRHTFASIERFQERRADVLACYALGCYECIMIRSRLAKKKKGNKGYLTQEEFKQIAEQFKGRYCNEHKKESIFVTIISLLFK